MSVPEVNQNSKISDDINWDTLIRESEIALKTCHERIDALNKSLIFFRKQKVAGIPYPSLGEEKLKRHQESS